MKFYCLTINDFATITVAKWDTAINCSSWNCFLCHRIGNVLTLASLSSYAFPDSSAIQISWERAIVKGFFLFSFFFFDNFIVGI